MRSQKLTLKVGDDEIPWALFEPEEAGRDYAVLWLQGWTASIERHHEGVERLAQATRTTFAMLDFAGHGAHKMPLAESTKKQQLDEVVAVYDELVRQGYERIIVIGGSFGAYMGALLTARRRVHALVLRAPANYDDAQFDKPYGQVGPEKDRPVDSAATEAVKDFEGFVYVMEHELDEAVARKFPQRYFEVAKHGNYIIIPKTPHSPKRMRDAQKHFEYIELMLGTIVNAVKLQDGLGTE